MRGIAAFWVLLAHTQILTGLRSIPILSWGGLAVDLFMMLSGFLMTHHYILRQEAEPWNTKQTAVIFWTRRFFRIAPLYYVLLIVALILGPSLGEFRSSIASIWPYTSTQSQRYLDQSILNLISHLTFVFGFIPDYAFRTALPDWSIGLEMQFYAAFPLIMLLVSRYGPLAVSATLVIGCFALQYFSLLFLTVLRRLLFYP